MRISITTGIGAFLFYVTSIYIPPYLSDHTVCKSWHGFYVIRTLEQLALFRFLLLYTVSLVLPYHLMFVMLIGGDVADADVRFHVVYSKPTLSHLMQIVCARAKFHFDPNMGFESEQLTASSNDEIFNLERWQQAYKPVNANMEKLMYFM
jgi:hypothetical protein